MNHTQVQTYNARSGEILSLLVEGLSPKEIAHRLAMTDVAVHSRLARLRAKEEVQTNTALVARLILRSVEAQKGGRMAA